jgi:DNA polymerase-3 subunit delta
MVVDTLKIEQELRAGQQPAPLYLLFGEEEFLIQQALRAFEEAASRSPFPAREGYLGKEVVARELVESACTLPLGGGFRLIIIDEAQSIPAAERERLMAYVEGPCPTSCVVFAWRAKKLEAKDKFVSALKGRARVLEFKRLNPGELKVWAKTQAIKMGLKVEPAALEALIEGSGGLVRDLAAELDKAALSVAKGGTLKMGDLSALSRHGSQPVYMLSEFACGGNATAALLALADAFEGNIKVGTVLLSFAKRIRQLILAAELSAQGATQEEIAHRLGTWPKHAAMCIEQGRKRRERLPGMLAQVLQADLDIKTGAAHDRERLERLILDLA